MESQQSYLIPDFEKRWALATHPAVFCVPPLVVLYYVALLGTLSDALLLWVIPNVLVCPKLAVASNTSN